MAKVLAAMSGGVDSAVAAARAKDAGHEVVGVHLALGRASVSSGSRGCCSAADAEDARQCAKQMDIPFYVWDFSAAFEREVVEDFLAEYSAGRTPNPCLRCNEKIKFAALLDRALALGFDLICTGHYARLQNGLESQVELHRSSSRSKDQSYVLGVLVQAQLRRCLFPLGKTPSKDLIRKEAASRGFRVAKKPDSHDICFIPDRNTRGYLAERLGQKPGQVVDGAGRVVGRHSGAFGYTIGQRRGLALAPGVSNAKPRYVLDISPIDNQVVVGSKSELGVLSVSSACFSSTGSEFGEGRFRGVVQIRAHAEARPAWISLEAGVMTITPDEPFTGVARGQSAVIYREDQVLGQLKIDDVCRR